MVPFLRGLFTPFIRFGSETGPLDISGAGSPEGVVTAPVGSTFRRSDGGTNSSLYRKENGTGNTGWVAISNAGGGGGTPQVFVQQTRPVETGPWVWFETDETGAIVDIVCNAG